MAVQGSLTVERMCQLLQVSRASFYRWLQRSEPVREDMELRVAIQEIALQHRGRYGSRRIVRELRDRGLRANRKRVVRLMRKDNLLAIQPRAFVTTTDSGHELEVALNLARHMKLTGINQLWVADITYIRLRSEFVYMAVVLDVFSRKVVGWAPEGRTGAGSATAVDPATSASAGLGAPFGPWSAICLCRLCSLAATTGDDSQHESPGQSLR
jgi:hypothetical protein